MNTDPADQAATTAPRTTTDTRTTAPQFLNPAPSGSTTDPAQPDHEEDQDVPTVGQRAGRLRAQGVRARTADPDEAAGRVRAFLPGDPPSTRTSRSSTSSPSPRSP